MRQILIVATLFALYDYPLACVTLVSLYNLCLFILMIALRPFARKRDMVQNTVNELCLNLACISAFYIGVLEKVGDEDVEYRMNIGWILVSANLFLIYFFMLMCAIEFSIVIVRVTRALYKYYRSVHDKSLNKNERKMRKNKALKDVQHLGDVFYR